MTVIFFIVFFTCCLTLTKATDQSSFYTAGVVEFQPIMAGMSSADMLREHLNAYEAIIASAEAQPTDIIVFPEGTLNNQLQMTYVPAPHDEVIPCDAYAGVYADFLVRLSCAARSAAKYIVINLTEKEDCPAPDGKDPRSCASSGLNIFNTNVVFDREGRVVSRYRKVHIYVEQRNTTYEPELAIFQTDFGVRFGHFICFDLLFYTPALQLVEEMGVTDVIFTSWFYSELPFLTGVQLQQSWSLAANVTFLAAGGSYPQTGTTGSGIYAGSDGQLITFMATNASVVERRLLVAQVPKQRRGSSQPVAPSSRPSSVIAGDLKLMHDPEMDNFESVLLDGESAPLDWEHRVCHKGHCCNFAAIIAPNSAVVGENNSSGSSGSTSREPSFHYRLGAFNGERSYEKYELNKLRICALYTCLDEQVSSCGLPFPAGIAVEPPFHFRQLRIWAEFAKAEKLLIMPNSLLADMLPLPPEAFIWESVESGHTHHVDFSTNPLWHEEEQPPLLTFAIYANYYDSAARQITPIHCALLLAIISLLLL